MITDALLSELINAWDEAITWDDKRLGAAITTLRTELEHRKKVPNETPIYHYHRRSTDIAVQSCACPE